MVTKNNNLNNINLNNNSNNNNLNNSNNNNLNNNLLNNNVKGKNSILDINNPSENNFNKCKKVMTKAPPPFAMFSIKDIIGGATFMYIPWVIVLLITSIIIII